MLPTCWQHVITLLAKSLQIACRASGMDMPQFHVPTRIRGIPSLDLHRQN